MSIEEMSRELEEMRVRLERIEARLGPESAPDTLRGTGAGAPSSAPLLDAVGDAIDALLGDGR